MLAQSLTNPVEATLRNGSPFFARTSELSNSQFFYEWSELLVSDVFSSVERELRAMRQTATVNDMSPLYKLEISGPDAARLVDFLVTKDTSSLEPGQVLYTPWCSDDGLLVNDGLVFRIAEDLYRITTDQSVKWFGSVAARIDANVEIADVSAEWGILSIQGPSSRRLLERATGDDWTDLAFSRRRETTIGGVNVDVSRQGFTGELGYELWVRSHQAVAMLDAVLEAGTGLGLELAGSIAIDVARVEAGLVLVSADYSGAGPDVHSVRYVDGYQTSPFAMGMGYLIDLDTHEFVGRAALRADQAEGGPGQRLVGLQLDHHAVSELFKAQGRPACVRTEVLWTPLAAQAGGSAVGRATSVTWSPTTGRLIGFGVLDAAHAEVGNRIEVVWDRDGVVGSVPATVVELPFVRMKRAAS